ncbi:ABC1 kinase family protein [Desulfatitalea alkaliphila]|uniref:AarF/UbiB family protein n=1 Tax=Desulfatitalea alkaliphila TaxID=2929485 RepID=A0AA41UHU6_9BACT|nr:AarF/UbiB family protein [Desulfatitalea alkaliphila]MCJ8498987.1 AarF/UbiB family protein [Desulfatitalea alkaliphila]
MNLTPTISPLRFKEIVGAFVKYGFEDVMGFLHLPGKRTAQKVTKVPEGLSPYERIRMAFEELGPTFVKFGQVMSLRSDLLPRSLIVELERLQDNAAPVDWEKMRAVLEENLPLPVDNVFVRCERQPMASASLSQVHRAVLQADGRVVALKIQRPGIRADIDRDLDIFNFIARRLHERVESLQIYNLPGMVDLLRKTLDRELNFLREARYMNVAREQHMDLRGIFIPAVVRELSSEKVLVMDHVEGWRPGDGVTADAPHLARIGLAASIRQILENGFFHADPHPGNMLIMGNETLALLDWGMVGRLTPKDRNDMIDLIGAVVSRDSDDLVDAILTLNSAPMNIDRRSLQIDVMELLDMHSVAAVEEINLGMLLLDISDLLRAHRLQVPLDLYLMIKALVTAEGTARLIDPKLDIIAEIEPHLRRLALARFKPTRIWQRFQSMAFKLVTSPIQFPRQVAEVVEKMQRGELRLRFEHHNLGDMRLTLEKTFSRLTLGIIAGATIIGSSLLLVTELPPKVAGYSLLGLIGYLFAGLMALWVVYDILRNR